MLPDYQIVKNKKHDNLKENKPLSNWNKSHQYYELLIAVIEVYHYPN